MADTKGSAMNDATNLLPEHQVLLLAVALGAEAGAAGRLRVALSKVTEWDYLLGAALQHGVFPLFYRRLTSDCFEAAPPAFFAYLRNLNKALARRNLKVTAELLQVLALLKPHDIAAIPFKGPVLAEVAYGDHNLRQFVDLDIIVRQQDLMRVIDLLHLSGYHLNYDLTKKQMLVHFRRTCEFSFKHPQKTMLDLHWRFLADYLGGGLDAEAMMARRVQVNLAGRTVSSLAPDDLLLVLCLHGTFHLWSKLGMINDVARLVQAQCPWNWPELIKGAQSVGLRRQLLLGLSLARELLGAPVPPEVVKEAEADPSVMGLQQRVRENIFMRSEEDAGFLEVTSFYLRTRDCFKDKIRHVWFRLAIPTVEDWRLVDLPDSCYGLYYIIRPLRLGWQGLVRPMVRRLRDWISLGGEARTGANS
jgi:hypothetical protein